jgi:hypothetical protein
MTTSKSFSKTLASISLVMMIVVFVGALALTLPDTFLSQEGEVESYEYKEVTSGIVDRIQQDRVQEIVENGGYYPEFSEENDRYAEVWQPVPEPVDE